MTPETKIQNYQETLISETQKTARLQKPLLGFEFTNTANQNLQHFWKVREPFSSFTVFYLRIIS